MGWSASSGRLSEQGRAFVAGILTHARALAALASPTVNSYKRLHAGAGGAGRGGVGARQPGRARADRRTTVPSNTGAPTRPPTRTSSSPASSLRKRTGWRTPSTRAPRSRSRSTATSPPGSEAVRYQPLPRSLDEALDALLEDDVFADAFDHRLLSHLVDGRRGEAEAYRAHVTSWELDRYLDES